MKIKDLKMLLFTFCGILLISACGRSGFEKPPEPVVNNLQISPSLYCSGEPVSFVWDVTHLRRNATKVELRTYTDQVLLTINDPSDTGQKEIPNYNIPSMYNFKIRGFSGDEYKEWPFLYPVINIDNPTWTFAFSSSRELAVGQPIRELYATNNGINEYNVYQMFEGYAWEIPSENFAGRAKFDSIQNLNTDGLTFRVGSDTVTLAQGATGTISNPVHPSTAITAVYGTPKKKFIGIQIGELTKPENPDYQWHPFYQEEKAKIKLRVFCDTN